MIKILFFLSLLMVGVYNTYKYNKNKKIQEQINRYNRTKDEEFEIILKKESDE